MRKWRKPKPSPPHYMWADTDNCWFCNNYSGCHGCKILKRYVADQKEKQRRKEDRALKQELVAQWAAQ